ncbi:hypothetical protein TH60_21335 [Pantoea ananatis]|nr:hypothetical protein [Pantoea ananatis]
MLNWLAVIVIFYHRLVLIFIHCSQHTGLLLTPADPKKGKSGSNHGRTQRKKRWLLQGYRPKNNLAHGGKMKNKLL